MCRTPRDCLDAATGYGYRSYQQKIQKFEHSKRVKSVLQGFKAELFKALGHPVRIRLLELLRGGERTVSDLQAQLEIEASSVSQQLAVLRSRQLVVGRKEGTSVYYRVTDPLVFDLLDIARAIFDGQLVTLQAMADEDAAMAEALAADHDAAGGPDA
jgi:DNA-binding transcriptional ArsR family regulator